jgi:hypothetical protein
MGEFIMKNLTKFLLIGVLVCFAYLQSVNAQDTFVITKMNSGLKYSANMVKISMELTDNFTKDYPEGTEELFLNIITCAEHSKKANELYEKNRMRKYEKVLAEAYYYYNSVLFLYNDMLEKQGKDRYQEVSSEDDIMNIFLRAKMASN